MMNLEINLIVQIKKDLIKIVELIPQNLERKKNQLSQEKNIIMILLIHHIEKNHQ